MDAQRGATLHQRGEAGARPRRLPVGAEVRPGRGVHFRIWAPKHRGVDVVLEGGPGGRQTIAMGPEGNGYFSAEAPEARAGTLYRFRPQGSHRLLADPASRYQPEGPHGPSQVVDPSAFAWTDRAWKGPREADEGHVLYEMHLGTFTPEGTFAAASEQLPYVASLGVTAIELMPVSEFPGKFGWSYDGVDLFATYHRYGTPDDFRRFVDRAHALGLAVLLDVVYNHLGPEGNVLTEYSDDYFSKRHITEWGPALNFDGENAGPVREFILANVGFWVDEYHIDGIRVDATQGLYDVAEGHEHIVKDLARAIREASRCRECNVLVVGESEPQHAVLLRPEDQGGCGYDMLWADDFHHAAKVAATGSREGYYGDYLGTPQELVSVIKRGWLYQGQWNLRQQKRRGTAGWDLAPWSFIFYLQNHDQIANSARGERLHRLTTPGRFRAVTSLLLLAPATPLIFQGQEYAASSPFLYFGDLAPEHAAEMQQGRRDFVKQFPSLATEEMQARVPYPADPDVFARSKLDPTERDRSPHVEALALHRDLIRLRREDPVFKLRRPGMVDGAVLGPEALVLRWFGPEGDDRLLVVNLGAELRLETVAEPLLAPPDGKVWRVLWSSEDFAYGGNGRIEPESEAFNWRLNAHSAVALAPAPCEADEHRDLEGSI